jgi:hypothetical protein
MSTSKVAIIRPACDTYLAICLASAIFAQQRAVWFEGAARNLVSEAHNLYLYSLDRGLCTKDKRFEPRGWPSSARPATHTWPSASGAPPSPTPVFRVPRFAFDICRFGVCDIRVRGSVFVVSSPGTNRLRSSVTYGALFIESTGLSVLSVRGSLCQTYGALFVEFRDKQVTGLSNR